MSTQTHVQRVTVTGWKFFQGAIDGSNIDSGRLFILTGLDESRGTQKGTVTAELRVPDAEHIKRIADQPLPLECDVELTIIGDGKGGFKQQCSGVKPVAIAKPQAVRPAP